jgi:hypothetical protein
MQLHPASNFQPSTPRPNGTRGLGAANWSGEESSGVVTAISAHGAKRWPYDLDVAETPAGLRRTGRIVLACGIVAAVLVYWLYARGATPTDSASAFAHTRSSDNQMSRTMGQFGLVMADWQAALSSPAGYAMGVLVLALLLAGYFFRVASIAEEDARERDE